MSSLSPSLVTIPFPDQSDDLIDIQLSARAITLAVDEIVTIHATLTNKGPSTALFDMEILGLKADWLIVPDLNLKLGPGQQHVIPITLKPPRSSSSRAGVHHFALKMTSPTYPHHYCQQRAMLTIQPYYNFVIEALTPRQQSLSWVKSAADYTLSLTNTGNISTRLRLTGVDQDANCHFEFRSPQETIALAEQADVLLVPQETVDVSIRVTPTTKPWLGIGQQLHNFTITALLPESNVSRSVLGQLSQKPFVGPGTAALLGLAFLLLSILVLQPFFARSSDRVFQVALATPVQKNAFQSAIPLPAPTVEMAPDQLTAPSTAIQAGYEPMFQQIAYQYNLDWHLLEAIAYHESGMNHRAVGASNDLGLMQVIPSTWNEWAPRLNVSDPFDPHSNILVGAAYLAHVRDFCHTRGYLEPQWMLIAYNWGPTQLDLFLDNGGTWGDIPLAQRQYALTILDISTRRSDGQMPSQEFYTFDAEN
ncbi:MAG: transglycosylase SLT domain-containing protein [Anaerolineae bacterium]|nr:transglycosylase SLT domain-containing protein [Anaerolineae bacterium]